MLELCSIVSLVTRLWAGQPRNSVLIRVVIFHFFKMPGLDLEPTQSPIYWLPVALFLDVKLPGMKLTTHLHSVLRLRMYGGIPALPCMPSYHS